jgi:hypothetical protein
MAEEFQIPQFKDRADFQSWWKRPEIDAFFKPVSAILNSEKDRQNDWNSL